MTGTVPTLVVFDLDDTLYEYEVSDAAGRAALTSLAKERLGLVAVRFEEAFLAARQNIKARLGDAASSHSRLLYCHEALQILGLKSDPEMALEMEQTYWRNYLAVAELRPGATDLLATLKYNGISVAIVTNLTAQIQFRKLIYLGIARYVDYIVCSEETSHEKASLGPFELLASRVNGADLEHVWFIGDHKDDAPVQELIERKIIGSGLGFVSSNDFFPSASMRKWDRFAEIERLLADRLDGSS